jgi:hypothetical protein
MSISTHAKSSKAPSRRPPTALQLALTIVTAGTAVASAALALVAPAQASPQAVLWEDATAAASAASTGSGASGPAAEATPKSEASGQATGDGSSSGSGEGEDLARAGLPGVIRAGPPAISRDTAPGVYPAPEPLTPGGFMTPSIWVGPLAPGMPLPVEGAWWVTCGYRCGFHTEQHLSTFALDMVRVDGKTAGQTVRSPVDGNVVVVVESSVADCNGEWITGPEAGAVIIIDFESSDGVAHRLRLAHLDATTIPKALRLTRAPVPVKAGEYLGSLAPMQGCEHLHFNLTRLEQGSEIPQPMVIEGVPLNDCGDVNCWVGSVLPPRHR